MKVVVTGVTRGLGRALAEALTSRGHTVEGCGRSPVTLDGVTTRVVDVRSEESVNRWAGEVLDRMGSPQLLVNNAALINRNAPLWEVPMEDFRSLLEVNLLGMFLVTRAFLPAMIATGRGVVVNLSSTWGRSVSSEVAPYCCTKWGVEGLTRALAQELPPGLAAVPLNPGIIDTDMLRSCFGASASQYEGPSQWASRAVLLLEELGPHHNGKPLSVEM